jgi:lipopolysaccharide export system protein LptA
MSNRAPRIVLLGLALLFAVTEVAGQRSCDLTSSRQAVSNQRDGTRVNYVSLPRFQCDDGTRIEADSSVTFEATSFTQLFGNVVFRDTERELHSDRAQYFDRVGRLQAQGSVLLTMLTDGSWVTGEDLILLQANEVRPEEEVTVRQGRPHAHLIPTTTPDSLAVEDSIGAAERRNVDPPDPYEIDADVIHLVGDRLFQARGRVEIINKSLQSYADSLEFQQDIGRVTLFDNARVVSQDTLSGDDLDLRGDTITMNVLDDQIDEMESRGRAQLLANEVDMRGPWIRLAFVDEELERVVAVRRMEEDVGPGPGVEDPPDSSTAQAQPMALVEDFRLTGDSIEAALIGGELDEVVATGGARGVSTARDSLNADDTNELIRNDWIEGDTITATFRSVPVHSAGPVGPASDGLEPAVARERELELLVARGTARSFYRTTPESETPGSEAPCALEINYVLGREVRLFMLDGEVERMEVDEPEGVNLQPTCSAAPGAASPEEPAGTPGGPDDALGTPGASDPSGPPGVDGAGR